MRAWQITKNGEPRDVLSLVDVPGPTAAEGMIRVAVDATGLGLPDVFMCRGNYAFKPELPFTPGQEIVGRVLESCAGGPAVGTRVMGVTAFFIGKGGYAEEALMLASSCFEAPDAFSDGEAAGFCIPYHTAQIGLVSRARLEASETLLVTGAAGSSGAAAIQLAKALGAKVIALAGGEEKANYCRALGADVVFDHTALDWIAAVNEETGGRGADAVYEVVGGDVFMGVTRCVASEGRILAVGFASGAWANASTARLVQTNASVLGVYVGAYGPEQMREVHAALLAHHAAGRIHAKPTREWAFDELPTALQAMADRQVIGKAVLLGDG
jgi:NADPH2:quinone reductase